MNRLRKQLHVVSFISYTFAFCIGLTAISGLTVMPPNYFTAYTLLAVGYLVILLFGDKFFRNNRQQAAFIAELVVLAAASLYELLIDAAGLMQFFWFVLAGFLLLYRSNYLAAAGSGHREILWNSTHSELGGLLVLYPGVLLLSGSPIFIGSGDWQAKLLAVFAGYLFFRIYALSLCYRLHTGNQRNRSLAASLLFLILLGGITYGIGSVWGGLLFDTAFRLAAFLLKPLVLGIGYLLQLLVDNIDVTPYLAAFDKIMPQVQSGYEELPPAANGQIPLAMLDWLLYALLFSLILYAAWSVYKKRRNRLPEQTLSREVQVEVREFLRKSPAAGLQPQQQPIGTLPEMRKTYRRLLKLLRKAGHVPAPHETALEFAAKVSRKHPPLRNGLQEITAYYSDVRYGGTSVHAKQKRADQIADEIGKQV